MNIERIKAELSKTYARIEQLQKRARDLEEQKKQAEDMEYLKIIRKHGVENILFATDFPWSDPASDIAFVSRLPLTEAEKDCIFWN